MSLPTDLPSCGEPAIAVFEIFTRTGATYSLDGRLNVCGAHVVPALTALRAADFEPHQATGGAGMPGRCGDGYDYVARTALTAPIRKEHVMSHPVPDPKPPTDDPTGLHALVTALELALAKARAGNRAEYAIAREAARTVEVRARRIDVALGDESYTADRDQVYTPDRIRRSGR